MRVMRTVGTLCNTVQNSTTRVTHVCGWERSLVVMVMLGSDLVQGAGEQ